MRWFFLGFPLVRVGVPLKLSIGWFGCPVPGFPRRVCLGHRGAGGASVHSRSVRSRSLRSERSVTIWSNLAFEGDGSWAVCFGIG